MGSGTISDITRYTAYKLKIPFILFPTAPSMDGFTSSGAALTIDNLKTTVAAKAPEAVFIDNEVIDNAPLTLKKAGFRDLMGKITAFLDWQLSHFLTGEKIDLDVLETVKNTYLKTLYAIETKEFSKNLLEGLIISGLMMTKVGSSRPASGSEHHISHFLEYHGVKTYHGIKVGLATLYILRFYKHFLSLSKDEILGMIHYTLDIDAWQDLMRRYFKFAYESVIRANLERVNRLNDKTFREELIKKLVEKKDSIDKIIYETLTIYKDLIHAYRFLDMPMHYRDLGIDDALFFIAFTCAPNIRDRFTILHLYEFLGLTQDVVNSF